jgi:hypothetical protein
MLHGMTVDIRFLLLALLLAACGDDSSVVPGADAGPRRDSGVRDAAVRDAGPAVLPDGGSFDAGPTPGDGAVADAGDPAVDGGATSDAGGTCPDPDDPHVMYVGRTVEECALADFICEAPFYTAFSNECGCGCLFGCPPAGTPGITYHSRDALECMIITVVCPDRETMFRNECGCGCITGGGRP